MLSTTSSSRSLLRMSSSSRVSFRILWSWPCLARQWIQFTRQCFDFFWISTLGFHVLVDCGSCGRGLAWLSSTKSVEGPWRFRRFPSLLSFSLPSLMVGGDPGTVRAVSAVDIYRSEQNTLDGSFVTFSEHSSTVSLWRVFVPLCHVECALVIGMVTSLSSVSLSLPHCCSHFGRRHRVISSTERCGHSGLAGEETRTHACWDVQQTQFNDRAWY